MPYPAIHHIIEEGGPVETASALGYGIAMAVAGLHMIRQPSLPWLSGVALLLWGMLRELDLQKAFTYRSIESLGFYTRLYAPWWQKVLALLVLTPFALAGLHLVQLLWRDLRSGTWLQSVWLQYSAPAVALAVTSSISEKWLSFDAMEEMCELGLALVILMLTWAMTQKNRADQETGP